MAAISLGTGLTIGQNIKQNGHMNRIKIRLLFSKSDSPEFGREKE
jgi:hypothetical protein